MRFRTHSGPRNRKEPPIPNQQSSQADASAPKAGAQPDPFEALFAELEDFEHLAHLTPTEAPRSHPIAGQASSGESLDESILAGLTLP